MTTRRKWSRAEKRAIVMEIGAPGGSVSEVARRHGVHTSLLFRWRRDLAAAEEGSPRTFLPVVLARPPAMPSLPALQRNGPAPSSSIEIHLVDGRTVRVDADVDATKLAAIIAALEARR